MSLLKLLIPLVLTFTTSVHASEFEISGALEFEYADSRTRAAGVTSHDNSFVATVDLGAGLQMSPNWRADLLLTTDLPDAIYVDEFVITYSRDNYSLLAGRYTLPFGHFETAVITDPQTLSIGETESSLATTFRQELDNVSWQLSWFNGNLRDSSDDESGFSVGANWKINDTWHAGIAYISAQGAGKDAPALYNLYLGMELNQWKLGAEIVAATSDKNGAKPQSWSLDAAYAINEQWSLGARLQQTNRFNVLDAGDGDYEELALAIHYEMFDNLNIGLEYADGNEGQSDYEQLLLQVAVSF